MKLKGIMTIELTDVNTQQKETIVEENMITDAVNDILGSNPLGIFYNAEDSSYVQANNWQGSLLPICPNMIGGILLFPSQLTEQAGNIYPPVNNEPTGYASNDVNTTTDVSRGSLNQVESKEIEGGYRFVWEFTPSQGNGMISAAALTSKQGGRAALGSIINSTSPFFRLKTVRLNNISNAMMKAIGSGIVDVDFETGVITSLHWETGTISIVKFQIPIFDLGLTDSLNGQTYKQLSNEQITPSSFSFSGSSTTKYGIFLDGGDGYWYGFSNGTGNSSGNASVSWIKISKADNSYTEGTWTLANTALESLGSYRTDSSVYIRQNSVILNGYLYAMKYNRAGLYKINLANTTDITEITFPDGYVPGESGIGGSSSGNLYAKTSIAKVNDTVFGRGWRLGSNDTAVLTQPTGIFDYSPMTAQFQYKEFLISWGTDTTYMYLQAFLVSPFLASINNLSGSVAKTADKMMKITYELTEQTS